MDETIRHLVDTQRQQQVDQTLGQVQGRTETLERRVIELTTSIEAKQAQLTEKLDSFYTKLIEIFGLFVAIFSFIIAGIQVATKQAGSFWEQLAISGAVFIPLTLCITVLLLMVHWVTRK
jgi:hypothetical protein